MIQINDTQIVIGAFAGENSAGTMCVQIGDRAGRYSKGSFVVQVGRYAGYQNVGDSCTQVGFQAGQGQQSDRQTAVGYQAGVGNVGARQVAVGEDAGRYNLGSHQVALGENAGDYNRGDQQVCAGEEAGDRNLGRYNTAIGRHAGRYNIGHNNTAVGGRAFSAFVEDTDHRVTFGADAVDAEQQQIAVPDHNFGRTGDYVNVKYATTGQSLFETLTNDVVQVQVLDDVTLKITDPWAKLTSAGREEDRHSLTPKVRVQGSVALGYEAEPDANNQVMLGGDDVEQVKTFGAYTPGVMRGAGAPLNSIYCCEACGKLMYKDRTGQTHELY